MWLNSLGICAHCQEPNDISDDTARAAEEPAKNPEPDDVPTHSTIGCMALMWLCQVPKMICF